LTEPLWERWATRRHLDPEKYVGNCSLKFKVSKFLIALSGRTFRREMSEATVRALKDLDLYSYDYHVVA